MNDLYKDQKSASGPVECLGLKFPSDEARREHFLKLLAEKLKDPAFRKTEGFPKGTDEAILAMSDPPYYTACPNPWLADFVKHYGKPYDPEAKYSREPLAIDVSVGKTDALYKAHSYHTKVPHLAIVPSILHYTEPGDIVLDGFAGSGMTGVAAQWCGCAPATYRHELEMAWKKEGRPAPQWGARRVVLNDLSPAATFIAANYNLPFDVDAFAQGRQATAEGGRAGDRLDVRDAAHRRQDQGADRVHGLERGLHLPGVRRRGEFHSRRRSMRTRKRVRDDFPCPHCGAELNKDRLERLFEPRSIPRPGSRSAAEASSPSLISYSVGKTRYEKKPDAEDLELHRAN